MNKRISKYFIAFLLIIGASRGYSQKLNVKDLTGGVNTITTAVPFLMISPDSRAGGMGDVGAATSPDANSIYWNASKLAFAEKDMGFSLSYTPWLRALVPDIYLAYMSGYKRINKTQTIGASLRYFSLGSITFTDIVGTTTGQFNPNEFSLDVSYSRKLSDNFSGGMALRYIYSNLTGGIIVDGTTPSHAGTSVAADVSGYYHQEVDINGKSSIVSVGLNISNIGAKVSYTETGNKDFIPINMRLGAGLKMNLDDYNQFGFYLDANKLLVPTPPIIQNGVIVAGKDPNVGIAQGIFQSFGDAPGGAKEEFREINYASGLEYWYDKQFAVRAGYFYEHPTKGNRQYLTFGAGLKYNVFGLDFAYLVPVSTQNSPLQNTLRFTLTFDFEGFKSQNKPEAQ